MDDRRYETLGLAPIRDKILAGQRLSLEDGQALFDCPDPHAVAALALTVRRRLHGDAVHYVINRHINPTNICVNRCRFCAYRRDEGQEGAYVLSVDQAMDKLARAGNVDEVHIVGGCHPDLGLDYYLELARAVRRDHPHASIKALTAVEVDHLARVAGLDTPQVLTRLRDAGVDMLPGGGAEIFAEAPRRALCPEKIGGERWLEIMGQAHAAGLRSNATMLFGHLETTRQRLEHLDALRRQQDATGGFVCFILLPYLPGNNPLGQEAAGPSAMDVLRTVAVSRLMLDNIPHIKAYWVMMGLKLAQLCLNWGADDLDGTVVEERIGHDAGSQSAQELTIGELEHAIRSAGFTPVRRDGLFRPQEQTAAPASTAQAIDPPHVLAVADRAQRGERLDAAQALTLARDASLELLGSLAHATRMRLHPEPVATYVVDRNVNSTNICQCGCRFCAFFKAPGQAGGYVLSREELCAKIEETLALGGRQILLQGGHNPDMGLEYYEDLLRFVRARYPGLHIHAFSPPEIVHFAAMSGLDTARVIARLKDAGLASIPGGGAEILVDRVRSVIAPAKCPAGQWLDVMRQAHRQGLRTTATMMFGHVETWEDRIEHLLAVRALQDETRGFTAFIPWSFQPDNTALGGTKSSPQEYLRVLALSRLVLDNVPNLQASWVTMGREIAQVALNFGANDFGSTMIEENVVAAAGVRFRMDEDGVRAAIAEAGFAPLRRNMDYTPYVGEEA